MVNQQEERIRVELSYPPKRLAVFERVKAEVEAKYPDADAKGKETDRNGSELMITLIFAPKRVSSPGSEVSDLDRKPYELTPTSEVHAFVSTLIEKYSESDV